MGAALGRRLLRLAMEQHLGHVTAASTRRSLGDDREGTLRDAETCSFGCSLAVSAKNAN
jgi:hypothetical protein